MAAKIQGISAADQNQTSTTEARRLHGEPFGLGEAKPKTKKSRPKLLTQRKQRTLSRAAKAKNWGLPS